MLEIPSIEATQGPEELVGGLDSPLTSLTDTPESDNIEGVHPLQGTERHDVLPLNIVSDQQEEHWLTLSPLSSWDPYESLKLPGQLIDQTISQIPELQDGQKPEKFDTSNSVPQKPKQRSRNGCSSCKQLRIKCGEQKPKCEYCQATKRSCTYPEPKRSQREVLKEERRKQRLSKFVVRAINDPANVISKRSYKSLNSMANHLQITNYELNLLHQYKHYSLVYLPSDSGPLANLLIVEAPKLFVESPIIRLAIFLFASLHLGLVPPKANRFATLNASSFLDKSIKDSDNLLTNNSLLLRKNRQDNKEEVLTLTNKYFLNLVTSINGVLLATLNQQINRQPLSRGDSVGLLVGGVLVFLFLGIHGHNIIPLVRFDDNDDYIYDFDEIINLNTDFMTIGQNIKYLSEIATLYPHFQPEQFRIPKIDTPIPVTSRLKNELMLLLVSTISNFEREIIEHHMTLLEKCLNTSSCNNHPAAIFKFLVYMEKGFCQLVRQKNEFALRVLNTFAFFCQSSRFGLFKEKNIWKDYMIWYKQYNLKRFNNSFKYFLDYVLYFLMTQDSVLGKVSLSELIRLDPQILYDNCTHQFQEPPLEL